jgi:hypothetical protein
MIELSNLEEDEMDMVELADETMKRCFRSGERMERDRIRPLLEQCEALVRAQWALNRGLRRPDDEAEALLGALLVDLHRKLGKES